MTTPVTTKDLEAIVARINRTTGSPPERYVGTVPQKGNYHLSGAYGGYALHRMDSSDHGGTEDVLNIGHVSKRELQLAMFAFIRGMHAAKN